MSTTDVAPVQVANHDLKKHARFGFILLGLIVLMVVGWGGLAQIAGAVVAPGQVALESSVKRVQHKEGGIVSELYVKEGDKVRAGQLLASIDSTVPRANLAVVQNQIEELTARRLRLRAERDGQTRIPASALRDAPDTPTFKAIMASEMRLMAERRSLRNQKKAQLTQQMQQARQQIEGYQAQVNSQGAQRDLIVEEVKGIRQLYDKGLATLSRLNSLEREASRLDGAQGELMASASAARTKISEIQVQMLQIDSEDLSQVMSDLKETEIKVAELTEQRVTSQDQLRRVELRSPSDGQVQQMVIHTKGGVVGPGETLMLIVPEKDELIVEAMIDPRHIDQVAVGRPAKVRFTAFEAAKTPVLDATVDRLSTDVQTNEKTGAQFYVARLRIDRPQLPANIRSRLVAGMPAEVQIATTTRNALSYFIKPLSDQMSRTFRED